ncbi:MAG: hypothetical protein KBI01_07985 [Oscillospiraceae bacterium]|nr:hypothetical protein [Oscillospiraceae bacterium]
MDDIGDVVTPSWSFNYVCEGFSLLADLQINLGEELKTGFESTGHYGQKVKLFLESNSSTIM